METVIMHPNNQEQSDALKAIAKAMKVAYETDDTNYNPAFVAKVLIGSDAKNNGKKGVRVDIDNLWK